MPHEQLELLPVPEESAHFNRAAPFDEHLHYFGYVFPRSVPDDKLSHMVSQERGNLFVEKFPLIVFGQEAVDHVPWSPQSRPAICMSPSRMVRRSDSATAGA